MSHRPPPTDTQEDVETVVLRPGDFHFGGGHTRISTLLGSCVSITLWHPRKRIGGMCHYMMAEREHPDGSPLDGRYAGEAFALFLRNVEKAGTRTSEYQAKLYGGANMFAQKTGTKLDIGRRNIEAAHRFLTAQHITVMAEHIGGSGRRKLHFDVWSGNVWLAFPEGADARIWSHHG